MIEVCLRTILLWYHRDGRLWMIQMIEYHVMVSSICPFRSLGSVILQRALWLFRVARSVSLEDFWIEGGFDILSSRYDHLFNTN
jgi:hypothetical protein